MLPNHSSERIESLIIMENQTEQKKGRMDSLEDVMMSVQVNLDNLF